LFGKVVECIWEEEWDKDLFCNAIGTNFFIIGLMVLIHENLKNRASLSSILKTLTSHSFNF
jgi:hypothetical protein